MERQIIAFVIATTMAAMTAIVLGYFLLYGFGVSRHELMSNALLGAATLAALLVINHIWANSQRPK